MFPLCESLRVAAIPIEGAGTRAGTIPIFSISPISKETERENQEQAGFGHA